MANVSTISENPNTGAQKLSVTLDTTGSSSSIYIRPGQKVSVALGGSAVGSVTVDLSFDDGVTFYAAAVKDDFTTAITVNNDTHLFQLAAPEEANVKARLTFTRTSGTLTGLIS